MSAIPKIDLQKIRVEDVYPFIRDLSVKLPFLIVLFSKVCINGTMYTTTFLMIILTLYHFTFLTSQDGDKIRKKSLPCPHLVV